MVSLASLSDPVEHARRRRTWTRGFSPIALKDHEETIRKRVNQLTETITARKSVDLSLLFGYLS